AVGRTAPTTTSPSTANGLTGVAEMYWSTAGSGTTAATLPVAATTTPTVAGATTSATPAASTTGMPVAAPCSSTSRIEPCWSITRYSAEAQPFRPATVTEHQE